jgi:hydroxymethylbilane synthase
MGTLSPKLKLGTRGSPLALAQAHEARDRLIVAHDWDIDAIEIVVIRTSGDLIQDRALSEAGGKGLFTRELDNALLGGGIDLAIHSAKDLPTVMPVGIAIMGYLPREDVRDVLISPRAPSLAALPKGALIGSASLRRQAQIRKIRPDLRVALLRGNVQTRLAKVESGAFAATLLALAGLKRLGLDHHATAILDTDQFLPAVGQGAIAVAVRASDGRTQDAVSSVLDITTGSALACERAFLTLLDGSCRTPIAGYAVVHEDRLDFRGLVLAPDGSESVETFASGPTSDAVKLGEEAARALLAQAPARILAPFQITG